MNKKNTEQIIRGTLRAYDKDKSGNVLQLFIQTDEFEKYIIDESVESKKLFPLINEEVIINCSKYDLLPDSLSHVRVNSFKIIKK